MSSVTYKNIVKKFGDLTIIKNLNIAVEDKEFLVLVGPSGCGKTTALRLLAGLEEISDGEIIIGDRVVNDVAPKDRDIAMVFQSYALYPHLSVYDNMAFGLKLRKTPKEEIDRRVNEAAEILGITDLLQRKPASSLVVSASVWLWDAPSCVNQKYSCSMNLFQTWTQNCVCKCALRSANYTSACRPHSSM